MIGRLKCSICGLEHLTFPAEGLPYISVEGLRSSTTCPNSHLSNGIIYLDKDFANLSPSVVLGTIPTGPVLDADFVAFDGACTAAGVTLSATEKTALNYLISDLKLYGLWAKCLAIYPFLGGVAASHKFNLKDPRDLDAAFRLSFVGSPTHSSNGVAWNGTSQYADTFVNPTINLERENTHISYYSRTNSGAAESEMGVYVSASVAGLYLNINFSGTEYRAVNSLESAGVTGLGTASLGFYTASRYTFAEEHHKRAAGATVTTAKVPSAAGYISANILLGAISSSGVASGFTLKACAFSSIGLGLSPIQLDRFAIIVQAYQTILSRNV